MSQKLTWERLVELEPALLQIEVDAKVAGEGDVCFCNRAAWYGMHGWEDRGFKDRMKLLVGYDREPYERTEQFMLLSSDEAYDAAYMHLNRSLPKCRKCSGCMTEDYLWMKENGYDMSDWC